MYNKKDPFWGYFFQLSRQDGSFFLHTILTKSQDFGTLMLSKKAATQHPRQKESDNHPDADWYTESERIRDVLERHDRTQERAALDSSLPDNWADVLSDIDILEIDEQLSHGGLEKMTPDEVDALIQSYLDPQRKAAIDALKNS